MAGVSTSSVPWEALRLLTESARNRTGGSQAARSFLFWLAGRPDPSGYESAGGLELRRLDPDHQSAALEIMRWWIAGKDSSEVLHEALDVIAREFSQGS